MTIVKLCAVLEVARSAASGGGLEPLFGPLWAILAALGACVGGLGPLLESLEAVFGSSYFACVGGLGPLSRSLWAVLCRAQGQCGRSAGPLSS